ncbi:hypothetical protein PLANTIT3_30272 [Plantibacter sp. T3]|nr:hypothetical protein PLANTIT3_30272 [Plantibacter sp. T3]
MRSLAKVGRRSRMDSTEKNSGSADPQGTDWGEQVECRHGTHEVTKQTVPRTRADERRTRTERGLVQAGHVRLHAPRPRLDRRLLPERHAAPDPVTRAVEHPRRLRHRLHRVPHDHQMALASLTSRRAQRVVLSDGPLFRVSGIRCSEFSTGMWRTSKLSTCRCGEPPGVPETRGTTPV